MQALGRRLGAEGVGSFFLFACVIGSGIMAEHLSGGNDGLALLANTIATGAMLFVLITMLGPDFGRSNESRLSASSPPLAGSCHGLTQPSTSSHSLHSASSVYGPRT